MSWRDDDEERFQASPRASGERRRRSGVFVGPLRLTPTRVTLFVALVGSLAFLLYAVTVRDPTQIPLLAAGAFVLGLVFGALALGGAISTYRAAADGFGGQAFAFAIAGGVAAVIAFGCFAGALILAFLSPRHI